MWIITRDRLNEESTTPEMTNFNRVGTCSSNYNEEKFAKADTIPIRLLDDDGNIYYEGRATRKRILDSSADYAFEPLDWAMNDAGATELQYFDNGQWQTL